MFRNTRFTSELLYTFVPFKSYFKWLTIATAALWYLLICRSSWKGLYLFSLTVSLDTYLFVMKEIHGLHRNGIPAEKISSHLSPWASALFEFLPHFIRKEVFSSSVYIYCFFYILCTKNQVSQPITTSEIHQYRHQVFIWVCKAPFLFILFGGLCSCLGWGGGSVGFFM